MQTSGLVPPPPMEMCSSTNSGSVMAGGATHSSAGAAVTSTHASRAVGPHYMRAHSNAPLSACSMYCSYQPGWSDLKQGGVLTGYALKVQGS